MRTIKSGIACIVGLLASTLMFGCAVDTGASSEQDVAETSDALANSIIDIWEGGQDKIFVIEFTKQPASTMGGLSGYRFDATIEGGIVCITTPCDTSTRVSGVYTATSSRITLASYDRPTAAFAAILGQYKYTVSSKALHLYNKSVDVRFHRTAKAPQCVTYETVDDSGAPLRNYYAFNVTSYAAGKSLLAGTTNFVNEQITPGYCSAPRMCTMIYRPVCGTPAGGVAKTYGNVCSFDSAIRANAGKSSSAKGHWEEGACTKSCATDSDCSNGFCGWNASNARVCKPYSMSGGSCGGFTLPQNRHVCAPGLTCVYPEPTHDVPGTCH